MSICWYCHWGWAKPVSDIYDDAVAKLEALGEDADMLLHYGPGHIVWDDENFGRGNVEYCIEQCGDPFAYGDNSPSEEAQAIVKASLTALLEVPDEIRDCWPEAYDGENPSAFPPPPGIEMVKR
jgi:hypothetical protein